jgi:hypothetical protein
MVQRLRGPCCGVRHSTDDLLKPLLPNFERSPPSRCNPWLPRVACMLMLTMRVAAAGGRRGLAAPPGRRRIPTLLPCQLCWHALQGRASLQGSIRLSLQHASAMWQLQPLGWHCFLA